MKQHLLQRFQNCRAQQFKRSEPMPTWVDLLAATGVVDSKSAARRIVKEGGAYLK